MSVNSHKQNYEQFQDWYKWFNKKYNRYNKIRFKKPTKKNHYKNQ